MAITELNATTPATLPPGAANVEDDIHAWEAAERREKWKLMIVRAILGDRAAFGLGIWHRPLV